MKKIITLLVLIFASQINFAQDAEYEFVYPPDVISPKFNDGGLDKFYEYVVKNFDFSKVTKTGTMITSFTVDDYGEIKNIRVTQFVNVESASEIIRVLKNAPKWQPATRAGKPFSVSIKFPLIFKEKESPKNLKEDLEISKSENQSKSEPEKSNLKGFIEKNYKYPNIPGLKGKVLVEFTINEDGTISDFKILKDLKHGTAEELIRVLKLTNGKWTPAKKDGKLVKSTFKQPLSINIPYEN